MPLPVFTFDIDDVKNYDIRQGGSPVENFEPDAPTASRTLILPWEDRYEVINWLLGSSIVESGTISRLNPQQYPGREGWYATKVNNVKGIKNTGTNGTDETRIAKYTHAVIEVQYELVPYFVLDDDDIESENERYTSFESMDPTAEYLQYPGGSLKYTKSGGGAPHGIPIPFGVGRVMPLTELTYIWHRVPDEVFKPSTDLYLRIFGESGISKPYLGTVNKEDCLGHAPGQLLFSKFKPYRKRSPVGNTFEWDFHYTFTIDPNCHNKKYYYRVGGTNNGFYYVGASGTNYAMGSVPDEDSLYNERDLNELWEI